MYIFIFATWIEIESITVFPAADEALRIISPSAEAVLCQTLGQSRHLGRQLTIILQEGCEKIR